MSVKLPTFQKFINNIAVGEVFYLNAINLSEKSLLWFKSLLISGMIKITDCELMRYITPSAWDDYLKGRYILPQAEYIKIKDL